jgi:hypothetical protein
MVDPSKYAFTGEVDRKGRRLARGPNGALVAFTTEGRAFYVSNKSSRTRRKADRKEKREAEGPDIVVAHPSPKHVPVRKLRPEMPLLPQASAAVLRPAPIVMPPPAKPVMAVAVEPRPVVAELLYVSAP